MAVSLHYPLFGTNFDVELIADEAPLNSAQCEVAWIGKAGSRQEGQAGYVSFAKCAPPKDRPGVSTLMYEGQGEENSHRIFTNKRHFFF